MNSRQKGKRGELEAAAWLREHGIEARRGCQFSGGPDSPDLVCDLPGFHLEVKRTERLALWEALGQAIEDAGDSTPVVLFKANKRPWVAILDGEDFLRMVAILRAATCGGKLIGPRRKAA